MKTVFSFIKKLYSGLLPRIFLYLIFAIIIPILVISLVNYRLSKQSLENEICKSNLDILKQTKAAVDSILEATERISGEIYSNNDIRMFWNSSLNIGIYSDIKIYNNILNVLDMLVSSNQHIDKIYMYGFVNDRLITSGSGWFKQIPPDEKDRIKNIINHNQTVTWIETGKETLFDTSASSIQLVRVVNSDFSNTDGIIVVQLKNDGFEKLIEDIYIRKTGYIFVINEKGEIIINGKHNMYFDSKWVVESEGYRIINHENQKLLLSYTTSKYNQWKYAVLLPSNELENGAAAIGAYILTICLVLSICAVFLSLIVSRGIYKPIQVIRSILKGEKPKQGRLEKVLERKDELGQINHDIQKILTQLTNEKDQIDSVTIENKVLKSQLDENISKLKNYFLYRIICGDISNRLEIANQAQFYDIPVNNWYMVIIAEFDRRLDEGFNFSDDLFRSGMLDIFEKTISRAADPIKVIYETNDKSDRIICILNIGGYAGSQPEINSIRVMCEFLQNIIFQTFNISVSIAAGQSRYGLEEIRNSYNQALHVLKYKFILGDHSVIFHDEMTRPNSSIPGQYFYKRHLINCLAAGDSKKIQNILQEFRDGIREGRYNSSECAYYCRDMFNILSEFLSEMNYKDIEHMEELNKAFINFEDMFDNIDMALNWFFEYVQTVLKRLDDRKQKFNKLIIKAMEMIQNSYNDYNLSLSSIAESLSVSDAYFSRLFKDETGKNFKEYLTEYKIEKAKELLKLSTISINEIASRVGYYNHKQFSAMFKKLEGVTPVEYRQTNAIGNNNRQDGK